MATHTMDFFTRNVWKNLQHDLKLKVEVLILSYVVYDVSTLFLCLFFGHYAGIKPKKKQVSAQTSMSHSKSTTRFGHKSFNSSMYL